MKDSHGFVFLELMAVVAIIGVLAAVALPAYQDYTNRAKVTEALDATRTIRLAINDYHLATGELPKDNATAGLAPPSAYQGNYFSSVTVADGSLHITFSTELTGEDQKVGNNQVLSM